MGVRLRPSLRAVKNAIDFDDIVADAINRQKGKSRKNKFAGAWVAARSATAWKLAEGAESLVNTDRDPPGSFRAVMVLGVVANVG